MSKMEKPAKAFLIVSLLLSAICFIAAIALSAGGGISADMTIKSSGVVRDIDDKRGETQVIAIEMPDSGTYKIYIDGLTIVSFGDDDGERKSYTYVDNVMYAYDDCISAYLYAGETYFLTVIPSRSDAAICVTK